MERYGIRTACSNGAYGHMIKFGTGGWRAVIGDDFTRENLCRVAQAVSDMLHEDGKTDKPIVIGFDRRFLSELSVKWLCEVFAANDLTVIRMNRSAPSPLVMHTVMKKGLHLGLEVTASHNPPEYDGLKVIVEEGRDAPVDVTDRIEALVAFQKEVKKMPYEEAIRRGLVQVIHNPFNDFIDDILALIDRDAIRERGLRVLFDPMHGSGTYPLLVILNTCRCTVDLINSNKDAYFEGGYPAPSENTLKDLSNRVLKGAYDFGLAFDGDGDRLSIVDGLGRYVSMNEILAMLYWYLHEYRHWKGPVVKNICTTLVLDRMARAFGEDVIEVPVGFKWVSAAIDKYDAVLGGESSGGLTVRGHIHGKDAVYAASLVVEMLCVTKMSIEEISKYIEEKFGRTFFVEDDIRFGAECMEALNIRHVAEKAVPYFDADICKISYMDGVKVYFSDGSFACCRFSGTEPLLRLMAEAFTKEKAQGYINAFKKALESELY